MSDKNKNGDPNLPTSGSKDIEKVADVTSLKIFDPSYSEQFSQTVQHEPTVEEAQQFLQGLSDALSQSSAPTQDMTEDTVMAEAASSTSQSPQSSYQTGTARQTLAYPPLGGMAQSIGGISEAADRTDLVGELFQIVADYAGHPCDLYEIVEQCEVIADYIVERFKNRQTGVDNP